MMRASAARAGSSRGPSGRACPSRPRSQSHRASAADGSVLTRSPMRAGVRVRVADAARSAITTKSGRSPRARPRRALHVAVRSGALESLARSPARRRRPGPRPARAARSRRPARRWPRCSASAEPTSSVPAGSAPGQQDLARRALRERGARADHATPVLSRTRRTAANAHSDRQRAQKPSGVRRPAPNVRRRSYQGRKQGRDRTEEERWAPSTAPHRGGLVAPALVVAAPPSRPAARRRLGRSTAGLPDGGAVDHGAGRPRRRLGRDRARAPAASQDAGSAKGVEVYNVGGAGGTIGLAELVTSAPGRPPPADGHRARHGRRDRDQRRRRSTWPRSRRSPG